MELLQAAAVEGGSYWGLLLAPIAGVIVLSPLVVLNFILRTERKGIDKLIESSKELDNDNLSQAAQFLLKSNKWKFNLVWFSIIYAVVVTYLSFK
jgi:hypothetical protein